MSLNNYIYETLPKEINTDYLGGDKDKIRSLFLKNPNISFRSSKIAELCEIKPSNTNVMVRKIITELIEIELIPIISDYKGYKLSLSVEELTAYQKTLQSRILGIRRRFEALEIIKNRGL